MYIKIGIHFHVLSIYVCVRWTWNIHTALYPIEAQTQLMFYSISFTRISITNSNNILMHNKYYLLCAVVNKISKEKANSLK